MATVIRTTEEVGHWSSPEPGYFTEPDDRGHRTWIAGDDPVWIHEGERTVSEQVLTVAPIQSRRGMASRKRVEAYSEGRGRRNRSAYQARALGSGQGVLARSDTQFTCSPDNQPASYRNAFPTGA